MRQSKASAVAEFLFVAWLLAGVHALILDGRPGLALWDVALGFVCLWVDVQRVRWLNRRRRRREAAAGGQV